MTGYLLHEHEVDRDVYLQFIHDAVRRWGGPKPLWRKAFLDNLALIIDVGVV